MQQPEGQNPEREEPACERPVIAVFDLDGTLTRYDTYVRYLLGFLYTHPQHFWRIRRLPFAVLMFKCRVRDNTWLKSRFLTDILGGFAPEDLRTWTQRFVDQVLKNGLRPSAISVLRNHQQHGDRTILLSASPDIFVKELALRLKFTDCICTTTALDNSGALSGALDRGNCYGIEKLRRMENMLGPERATVQVVSYSDHHSDLPLLCWSNRGVLVNPSPRLRRVARAMQLEVVNW